MKHPLLIPTLLAIGLLLCGSPRVRAEAPPKEAPKEAPKETTKEQKQDGQAEGDKLSVTEHELAVNGQPLKYRATAGTLAMKDDAGKHKADLFFVAYEKLPAPDDRSQRPVTFVFNGGPGAAAVWLHLGTAGPKRVKLQDNGEAAAPPYAVIDNPHTWLDSTDLVFIDPVNTGYSRAAPGEDPKQFFGLREDVNWVAEFIRLYTTRFKRWASPKFLAGESYGTTRAAALADHLLEAHGINLNGVILISSVLDFQTLAFGNGNTLGYPLFLPTYAATAWYHKKLPPDLQQQPLAKVLAEVEDFARGDYVVALARGASLDSQKRQQAVQRLARYTGLTAETVEKADLRIDPGLFRKKVLADSRQIVGRFDGRVRGNDPEPLDRDPQYDPSLSQYLAAYSGAFNQYVRHGLKFESDRTYDVLSGKVHPWNFGGGGGHGGYVYVADNLRAAMLKNSHLRVLIASGYYDLATPYLATKYTVDQLGVGPELRKNIDLTFYDGGHMMYHHKPDLEKLDADVAVFIAKAVGAAGEKAAKAE